MYEIRFAVEARDELRALRRFDRNRILDAIQDSLRHQPDKEKKHRKKLEPRQELSRLGPLWELRVDVYRVFYRVVDEQVLVLILKIVRKGRKTTMEIL